MENIYSLFNVKKSLKREKDYFTLIKQIVH